MTLAALSSQRPSATCLIAGEVAVLDCTGALFFPATGMMVVSDMHLEKGTSWARRGIFLPPYDSSVTLAALEDAVAHFVPSKLLFLGDSFHDAGGPVRLADEDRSRLENVCSPLETIWVTGNHDPEIPDDMPGASISEIAVGSLHFTHIPQRGAMGQISGHLHPVATIKGRGRTVRRRCFAADGNRLIMPAFGAYTGGLNIRETAFDGLFENENLSLHMIGDSAIHSLPGSVCGR